MGEPIDASHLLPDEDWAAVVAAAQLEAQRIAAGEPAPEAPDEWDASLSPGRYTTGLALPLAGAVHAPRNGGRRAGPWPTFGVLHSAETPLQAGYAASIARYFRDKAPTSCHYMTDPAETWGVLPDELVAWHCGTGNTNSLALEQAGYARFSRAEWLVPAGHAQLRRNAAVMRAARDRYGIGLYWMTDAQLLAAHRRQIVGGWATHDQCRRVLRGTDHTDPGGGFPLDVQMAHAIGEDEDMPLSDEDLGKIADRVWGKPQSHGAWQGVPPIIFLADNRSLIGDTLVTARATLAAATTLLARPAADVDEQGLAAALGPLLPALVAQLPTEQLERIAELVNDVRDRRERDGDPATGPVS